MSDPRIKRLFESRPQYVRDYVIFMAHRIDQEVKEEGLPVQFIESFAFLALWQQMCCVTIEGARDWTRRWDQLLEAYHEHKAVRVFVEETEALFMETLSAEDIT